MKHIFYLLLLALFTKQSIAQQQYPTTLSNAGNSSSNGGILLESSLGGLAVNSLSTPTFLYTQGFLQPDAGISTFVPSVNDVVLSSGSGLDNAGTTFISGNIMLEFTTGEAASITHINSNQMVTQGILQPYSIGSVVPVTGLELTARRTDAQTVLLSWKTLQEINNKGFHIERKLENENSFATVGYLATAAIGGNSSLPLLYQKNDNNSFAGKTYYRIRQEDIDGTISYSPIRMVEGIGATVLVNVKVWPIPATGPVSVLANGLATTDHLQVFDMNGKLVQQQTIQNNVPVVLNKLVSGTYVIKLAGNKELIKKIIVQ